VVAEVARRGVVTTRRKKAQGGTGANQHNAKEQSGQNDHSAESKSGDRKSSPQNEDLVEDKTGEGEMT
jgi:hypothetical protein